MAVPVNTTISMDPSTSEFKSKGGFKRIASAFGYSLDGFRHAWRTEHAFRQELMVALPAAMRDVLEDGTTQTVSLAPHDVAVLEQKDRR